jgi:hypothetical protein
MTEEQKETAQGLYMAGAIAALQVLTKHLANKLIENSQHTQEPPRH